MNWLIGESSCAIELTKTHWNSYLKGVDSKLLQFIDNNHKFLSPHQRNRLFEITYLDSQHPFGRIDMHTRVGRVSTSEFEQQEFEYRVHRAIEIIKNVSPVSDLLEASIHKFIPLSEAAETKPLRKDGSGKSCHWLIGAVFLSLPNNHRFPDLELAINIVHELGHQLLMRYQDGDEILANNHQPIYSAIRKVSRPAILSLHALVAIYFMRYFLVRLKMNYELEPSELAYVEQKLVHLNSDFTSGAWALKDVKFSNLGYAIFTEMISQTARVEN
jgi:HEXXH motif-containing protein